MFLFRWIIAGVLLICFAWVASANAWISIRPYLSKKNRKNNSLGPFIGGLVGMAGFLIAPNATLNSLWWLPLVLDIGCVFLGVVTIVYYVFLAVRPEKSIHEDGQGNKKENQSKVKE